MAMTIKHFGLLQNLRLLRSLLYQPCCCQAPQRQFVLRSWKWCFDIRHGAEHFTLILVPCVIDDVSTSRTYHHSPVDRPLQRIHVNFLKIVAHDAHELLNLWLRQRLRHQVSWVHVRADLFRESPCFGSLLYPQVLHIDVLCLAQASAVDQAQCC